VTLIVLFTRLSVTVPHQLDDVLGPLAQGQHDDARRTWVG